MGFLALGAIYWRYEQVFANSLRGWHIGLLIVSYVVFFSIFRHDAHVLVSMRSLNFLGFVGSALGCLLMVTLCKFLPPVRFLTFIGTNSIVFYLLSDAVPVVLNVVFKRMFRVPSIVDFVAYFVLCVALATAITYIIKRFLPFLTDIRRRHAL